MPAENASARLQATVIASRERESDLEVLIDEPEDWNINYESQSGKE
jgi:hypothetical protein